MKKDRLEKLHVSVTHMILNSSATYININIGDNDVELQAPLEPVESCRKLHSYKTAGLVEQELCEQFKALKMSVVDFTYCSVQALLAGIFTYSVGSLPSIFFWILF